MSRGLMDLITPKQGPYECNVQAMFKFINNIVSIALNNKSYWVLISLTHFSK
jgi:hypothetical protein